VPFLRGYNYTLNENGQLVHYGTSEEDYLTDVLRDKGLNFIQRTVPTGAPFFMYIAPSAPHWPAVSAPRHKGLFPGVKAPRTLSFNEADVSDKPKRVQKFNVLSDEQISNLDASFRNRLRSIQAVDEMLADILKVLESANLLEQTYIIFTSIMVITWAASATGGKDFLMMRICRCPLLFVVRVFPEM
jgi:arylsulfatase A-like enzyme